MSICLPFSVVSNESELQKAILEGGRVFWKGPIQTNNDIIIHKPITIEGVPNEVGVPASVIRHHVTGASEDVFQVKAPNVSIDKLTICSDQVPPTSTSSPDYVNMVGVRISDLQADNCDNLSITNCEFHHLANCIIRQGSSTSAIVNNLRILNNLFYTFNSGGINVNFRTNNSIIDRNVFKARLNTSDTHVAGFNAIGFSNSHNQATISNNEILNSGRHAIEFWNSVPGGNYDGRIFGNKIHDNGWPGSGTNVGSFGISAFGNGTLHVSDNTINGGNGIGIECYNDSNNTAINNIHDNTLRDIRSFGTPVGISVDGAADGQTAANIYNNIFERMVPGGPTFQSFGIQIIHGAHGVRISQNEFIDAGNINIYLNGASAPNPFGFNVLSITNNLFRFTKDAPAWTNFAVDAMRIGRFGKAEVKNNTSFHTVSTLQNPAQVRGRFILEAPGWVWEDDTASAIHKWVGPGDEVINKSNIRINY